MRRALHDLLEEIREDLPVLRSLDLPNGILWVTKPGSRLVWTAGVVYPDQVRATPQPGDHVYVYDQEHVYLPVDS